MIIPQKIAQGITTVDPDGITEDDARRAGAASVAEALAALRSTPGQPVYRIGLEWVGEDPRIALSSDDDLTDDTISEIAQHLERLDARSSHGPWTGTILQLVADNPGRRAPDLAARRRLPRGNRTRRPLTVHSPRLHCAPWPLRAI